ncbi:glutamate carboxypeptidase 2 [Diplocarpon mali]|nr:glutamate carboxypeptidase 2 [Diplocarpon mali]
MWNVITHVNGTNEDETVVVGNHHDTWMISGAGDPNSDSAIPIELAKALGKLLKSGCKPRRTMMQKNTGWLEAQNGRKNMSTGSTRPRWLTSMSMGRFLTLLAYHLADDEVLPLAADWVGRTTRGILRASEILETRACLATRPWNGWWDE